MSLRILHVAPFLGGGGVGNVALSLSREFTEMGHEIILASPENTSTRLKNKLTFIKLSKPRLKDPFYALNFSLINKKRIISILKSYRPDVILTHGPLVLIQKYAKRIPVFSIIHGTYAQEIKFFRFYPLSGFERLRYLSSILLEYLLEKEVYKKFSRSEDVVFIAVSKNTKKELMNMGIDSTKIFPIINGVDKHNFIPRDKNETKKLISEIYPIQDNITFLHVNPSPRKGTHILIEAAKILKTKFDFKILIAGKIMLKTFNNYIIKKIENYGLKKSVLLLGYVDEKLLKNLYNAADVTVVPSYSEGSPLVIPESLASGTPVVATDVGGNREYLEAAGLENLIVNINRYDFSKELASICEKSLNSSIKLRIEKVLSWHDVANNYIRIFKNF